MHYFNHENLSNQLCQSFSYLLLNLEEIEEE